MRLPIFALLATALTYASASAQQARVCLSADPSFQDPELIAAPGPVDVHVLITHTPAPGVRSLQFRVSAPVEFVWVGDTPVFPGTTGISPGLVRVDLGECRTAPIHVLTVRFVAGSVPACVQQSIQALEVTGCGGTVITSGADDLWVADAVPAVTTREPADGATAVSLDTDLRWSERYCYTGIADIYGVPVRFGTDHNPPEVGYAGFDMRFDPGALSPNTTYYWSFVPFYA
jgi:hypothetical protein